MRTSLSVLALLLAAVSVPAAQPPSRSFATAQSAPVRLSPLREQAVVQQELNYVDAAVTGLALLMAVVFGISVLISLA